MECQKWYITNFFGTLNDNFLKATYKNNLEIPDFYSDTQLDFLQGLLKDCLNQKPEERPSAAQVGELMQIFSSSLEENGGNGKIMPYAEAKKLAEEIITKLNDGTSWETIQKDYKDKITYGKLY